MITVAQLVESAHCLEESIELIDEILEAGIQADQESARVDVRQGRGVGAVEAPRGILFHDYELNAQGACLSANLVIPTAQNLANLEADMRELTPRIIHKDQESITRELEMLVRAYDPCISCSTHMVEIDFGDMRGTGL
jgi:coenzyme F420-reducing hydrogenase alpha subunit